MPWLYQTFGLTLQANRPIPGLAASPDNTAPSDVSIDFRPERRHQPDLQKELWYESLKDRSGHLLRVWKLDTGHFFLFHYNDGAEFLIDGSGKHVAATWPQSLTFEDMASYLIGPVLGFVLRLHGVVCLHASAVVIHNLAVALLSPSGYGKSSAAAAFAQRGYPVLSDDIVAVIDQGDRFQVQPGFPRLQLWPSSVRALFGDHDALPRITPENDSWDKRFLDLCQDNFKFQGSPVRLAAVYTGKHCEGKDIPRLDTLSAHEGFLALTANTYSSGLLDKKMRALEFDVLSRLAAAVPVKCLKSQKFLIDLNRTCDLVLDDALGFLASVNSPERGKP